MDRRHRNILISIILVVSLISLMDIMFLKSGMFGSEENYIVGAYTMGLWPLFFKLSISLMFLLSAAYYFYFHKDISESIAIFSGSYILWAYAGISDLLFFWLQFKSVPAELPWLSHNVALQPIASILGYTTITNTSLYVSAIVGLIVIYFTTKLLKERI